MRTRDVSTLQPIGDDEISNAAAFYTGTDEQPPNYDQGAAPYAHFVTDVLASTRAGSVLEFGCNAGRNLDLLRTKLPGAALVGLDLNPKMVAHGQMTYGLDLRLTNEQGLAEIASQSVDVAFTVSVVDHIPYPEFTLRHLLRVARHYLVMFEIVHDRLGKADQIVTGPVEAAETVPAYPYSYFHDYRYECEKKFGAHCVADIHFPIRAGQLSDLYRLYVFTPRGARLDVQAVERFTLNPIG